MGLIEAMNRLSVRDFNVWKRLRNGLGSRDREIGGAGSGGDQDNVHRTVCLVESVALGYLLSAPSYQDESGEKIV